jgi:Uncharacterized protein conserved in bacteria
MQSIGERLEEARKRKGISIREAAEATKIRGDYLHKFEGNQYDIRLPEIYVRGFLRSYANYLKLPAEKIISDYNALGLNESKRSLSREVYGRMDISHSNKAEKAKDASTEASPENAPQAEGARNPATFVPPTTRALNLDKKLLVKFGSISIGAIVLVSVLIWALFFRESGPTETWVRPGAGDRVLSVIASAPANVVVTQSADGTVLYEGTIPAGRTRDLPRRGKLNIRTDAPERIRIRVDTGEFDLKDASGRYLTTADINP